MPRQGGVCAHRSVWSPTSLCAAAMAPPTIVSVSCMFGPAKNRWTSVWSAKESAVSNAYIYTVLAFCVSLRTCRCWLDPSNNSRNISFLRRPIVHWPVPLLCANQKHAAALFVPGAPSVSRTSVSAHSAQAKRSPRCAEVMAPPTITGVNLACRPACRRGELMWWRLVIAMKVGNGL